jgi:phage internal scaffolding protein
MSVSKKFISLYSDEKLKVGLECKDESRTLQSHKELADVNNILKKYSQGLPINIKNNPIYDDFSSMPELQEAYSIVQKAEDQFMGLPSSVRKKFNNNPEEFLSFVADPKNTEEMQKLGLANKKEVVTQPEIKPE